MLEKTKLLIYVESKEKYVFCQFRKYILKLIDSYIMLGFFIGDKDKIILPTNCNQLFII